MTLHCGHPNACDPAHDDPNPGATHYCQWCSDVFRGKAREQALRDRIAAIEEHAIFGEPHPDRGDDPLFQAVLALARGKPADSSKSFTVRQHTHGYTVHGGVPLSVAPGLIEALATEYEDAILDGPIAVHLGAALSITTKTGSAAWRKELGL
jgi:hypothetical protein